MHMKKATLLLLSIVFSQLNVFAQKAYINPSPTGKNDTITLFINVAIAGGALSEMLDAHPDETVYLWGWEPREPRVGNGQWASSNDALAMTRVSPNEKIYSIRFLPTDFYNVDATEFFLDGIKCLAKLKDGYTYQGDFGGREAKTDDLAVGVVPKLCNELFCVFPELCKADDYFAITYDNRLETRSGLQNMGPDECYLYLRADPGNSPFVLFPYAPSNQVVNTPELKMKYLGDGKFRLTILPTEFFKEAGVIPDGFNFQKLHYYIMRPGYNYPGPPPSQAFTFLDCID